MSILNLNPETPTLSQLENAFQPAREVSDPEKFAGRKDAVHNAYFGLISEGAHIAIVGGRGIGKSSLSRQVMNIAQGDNDLLAKLQLAHDRKLDFLSVYHTCGSTTANISDLLQALLSSKTCLADWIYDLPQSVKMTGGISPTVGGSLAGIELKLAADSKVERTTTSACPNHSIEAIFTNVVHSLASNALAQDGILIVVDEIRSDQGSERLCCSPKFSCY